MRKQVGKPLVQVFAEESRADKQYPEKAMPGEWCYIRKENGFIEVLDSLCHTVVFWPAPQHRAQRADDHERLAKQIVDDHNIAHQALRACHLLLNYRNAGMKAVLEAAYSWASAAARERK